MIRYVYDKTGLTLLREEEATPECGDYCDACGDCLHCYIGDNCYSGNHVYKAHFWVIYLDEEESE